jgi:hypothetical protein
MYFINILLLDVGVLKHLLNRFHCLPEQIHIQFLELCPRQGLRKVIPTLKTLYLNLRALLVTQSPLRLFHLPLQFPQSPQICRNVCPSLLFVQFCEMVNDAIIEIFSTEMGVSSSGEDFKDTFVNREKGDIKCASAEIIDNDLGFAAFLVETVGNSGSCWFVDDTKDLETGDGARIFGRLALSIVEVYRK